MSASAKPLRIAEIFGPTIQGEGALIGRPSVFVRAGGCDYRCRWCDSLHAVESRYRRDWQPMDGAEILAEVERLSGGRPLTVTLTGGNPAIQDFAELIALGQARGYRFALETQGSVAPDWLARLDLLVLSPKPPSSGHEVDWQAFEACLETAGAVETVLKIPVLDETDYDWARGVAARYPGRPLYLMPVNATPPNELSEDLDLPALMERMDWLVQRTLADGWFEPTILPQLHVLLWGNKRGV